MSKTESILSLNEITLQAEQQGICDKNEILESIRFLNDLGSLQYFEISGLKEYVVINPQWIVNVISCVVSVKDNQIENGRLYHIDLEKIWKNYDQFLHEWMLKLTEEFDLTFQVNDKQMNIVPCLLNENEPELDWLDISQKKNADTNLKEFKVNYNFDYLPTGLFNRIQVRLFQYGNDSSIWKYGSYLVKNKQKGIITQTNEYTIEVRVQGFKPENMVFLIHEVIETLINEHFRGISYDYSFPCPECIDAKSNDPCLFSSDLLRRATEFKAPFLQCNKFFHAISVEELMSLMPINGINLSNIDLNLEYSIRDLKQLQNNLKYDIMFWYNQKDSKPTNDPENFKSIDPIKVIKQIKNEKYKIWYSKNPSEEKMDKLTQIMKESKLIILGISDEFALDEKCKQVFELTKNIIKKKYLLIEFGVNGQHDWMENSTFASICTDYRVIMQDPNRYSHKINEMFESIQRQLENVIIQRQIEDKQPDVFISYCWSNSHEAVEKGTKAQPTSLGWLDPRSLKEVFKQKEIEVWLDIEELSTSNGLFGEIVSGMKECKCVVACFSDEYAASKNCLKEFRFASVSLKLPIIKCIVGTSNEWRKHEIGFLSSDYPEVNFQIENQSINFKEKINE